MGNVDLGNLIITGLAVFVSIWAWLSSNRTKREQAKLNREKQEYEAFLRIQDMYTECPDGSASGTRQLPHSDQPLRTTESDGLEEQT